MWLFMGLGAICAGLFLASRDLLPWFNARRSGVILTKGLRPQKVDRAVEPERFETMTTSRLKSARVGLLVLALGVAWLAWNALSLVLMTPGG